MTPMEQLAALGYTVGKAQYDVEHEEQALEGAVAEGAPEAIEAGAAAFASEAANYLRANGVEQERLVQLVAQATAQAVGTLTARAEQLVEHHQRAVEIAREHPTVWVVSGFGITNLYVAIDDATGEGADAASVELLASLLNPEAHAERERQFREAS